jgi:hypothetical protein
MQISVWWSDTARLYLRYATAVAASVPAGAIYAYLAIKKLDGSWSTIALLIAGSILATIGWHFSERFIPSRQTLTATEAYPDFAYSLEFRLAVMAASFVFLCSEPAKYESLIHKNLVGGDAQVLCASPAQPGSVEVELRNA